MLTSFCASGCAVDCACGLNKIRKRLGEVFVCVFLDECVDKVRGGSAQSGVVNRGDLDEAFLEKGRRAPALCDLGSTSLSFITDVLLSLGN